MKRLHHSAIFDIKIRSCPDGRKRHNCEACLCTRPLLSGNYGIDLKGGAPGKGIYLHSGPGRKVFREI